MENQRKGGPFILEAQSERSEVPGPQGNGSKFSPRHNVQCLSNWLVTKIRIARERGGKNNGRNAETTPGYFRPKDQHQSIEEPRRVLKEESALKKRWSSSIPAREGMDGLRGDSRKESTTLETTGKRKSFHLAMEKLDQTKKDEAEAQTKLENGFSTPQHRRAWGVDGEKELDWTDLRKTPKKTHQGGEPDRENYYRGKKRISGPGAKNVRRV